LTKQCDNINTMCTKKAYILYNTVCKSKQYEEKNTQLKQNEGEDAQIFR
jgi:hypothetical protein